MLSGDRQHRAPEIGRLLNAMVGPAPQGLAECSHGGTGEMAKSSDAQPVDASFPNPLFAAKSRTKAVEVASEHCGRGRVGPLIAVAAMGLTDIKVIGNAMRRKATLGNHPQEFIEYLECEMCPGTRWAS
jgi:hypothetical protein